MIFFCTYIAAVQCLRVDTPGEGLDGKEEGRDAVGTGGVLARYLAAVRTKHVETACRRAGRQGKEEHASSLETGTLAEEVL